MGASQMRGRCMSPNAMLAMKWGDTSRCVRLWGKGREYREVNTSSERRLTHASGCHKKGKYFQCTRVDGSVKLLSDPTQLLEAWTSHFQKLAQPADSYAWRPARDAAEVSYIGIWIPSERKAFFWHTIHYWLRKSNAPFNRKWSFGKCPGKFVMGVLASSYGYLKQNTLKYYHGIETSVLCREVVPISEGPLSKVPLYVANKRWHAPAHKECSFGTCRSFKARVRWSCAKDNNTCMSPCVSYIQ